MQRWRKGRHGESCPLRIFCLPIRGLAVVCVRMWNDMTHSLSRSSCFAGRCSFTQVHCKEGMGCSDPWSQSFPRWRLLAYTVHFSVSHLPPISRRKLRSIALGPPLARSSAARCDRSASADSASKELGGAGMESASMAPEAVAPRRRQVSPHAAEVVLQSGESGESRLVKCNRFYCGIGNCGEAAEKLVKAF